MQGCRKRYFQLGYDAFRVEKPKVQEKRFLLYNRTQMVESAFYFALFEGRVPGLYTVWTKFEAQVKDLGISTISI